MRALRRHSLCLACVVGVLSLLLYLPSLWFDFVNLDDPFYVYDNPAIRLLDWTFIREAFTTSYMGWWMPLTWISLALDYHFWQLNPFGYHLTNVLLHAINASLVVLIAERVRRCGALSDPAAGESQWIQSAMPVFAGLLWAVHPLRVESVAWVTERKDVLSGSFFLLSILFYLRHVQASEPELPFRRWARPDYLLSLACLVVAMMAKPVSVVIPAMLLVMDWYPLGRMRRETGLPLLLEKLPFLVLGGAVALLTVKYAACETILVSFADFPLYKRLILAGHSLVEYWRMMLYPIGLVHLYLLPREFPPSYYIYTCVGVVITVACLYRHKKSPFLLATWLLFLLPLLPVLGIFQNGAQSHADRFTYLPAVAPSIAAAAAISSIAVRLGRATAGRMLAGVAMVILLCYGGISVHLLGAWRNSETLWSRLISIQPVGRAFYYRGEHYLKHGNFLAAVNDLQVSIRMAEEAGNPEVLNLYALRGFALSKLGRFQEAVRDYSRAIEGYPEQNFFYHRGVALKALGRREEAEADFKRGGTATGPIEWHRLW